ncbi:hypothetical protein DUNSADRAFT_4726 [Dunaliella salina]|uniref:Uncharacterized protein n=1 Tax=Dunaliella salina TaxID=3046 RepID=A0ABQ7H7L8_DUNSA|nr:hypothetical protein DUNSADRAFT_4726 [Dunaliella salina]|eukprot:KAF5842842.1 hypothetical protein DUNSADRAFT_4726 [Dunaliella salina]
MQLAAQSNENVLLEKALGSSEPFTAHVKSVELKPKGFYKACLSVGARTVEAALATQLSPLVQAGQVRAGSTIKVKAYTVAHKNEAKVLLSVTDVEVLSSEAGVLPLGDATASINLHTPATKSNGAARKLETPPEPSPSEEPAAKFSKTPQGAVPRPASNHTPPTPSQSTPSISNQTRGLVPFSFLNPYNADQVCKAKVCKKFPLRHLNSSKKLVMEFVDGEGTQIQGTFWRDAAEKYDEQMREGAVYILRKFQVKPANKQYSTVMNDYELHFSDKSVVEEFADQSAAETMAAGVHIVPIPKLPQFTSRKAPVDVMGVVTGMGDISTIRRKSDMSEFTKRELTITDKRCFEGNV